MEYRRKLSAKLPVSALNCDLRKKMPPPRYGTCPTHLFLQFIILIFQRYASGYSIIFNFCQSFLHGTNSIRNIKSIAAKYFYTMPGNPGKQPSTVRMMLCPAVLEKRRHLARSFRAQRPLRFSRSESVPPDEASSVRLKVSHCKASSAVKNYSFCIKKL